MLRDETWGARKNLDCFIAILLELWNGDIYNLLTKSGLLSASAI